MESEHGACLLPSLVGVPPLWDFGMILSCLHRKNLDSNGKIIGFCYTWNVDST